MREARQHYAGTVEIWVDGDKRADVEAVLTGWVEVYDVKTFGGRFQGDAGTTWDGVVSGLSQHELLTLMTSRLELRFPDGRAAMAHLDGTGGGLKGVGATPFGDEPPEDDGLEITELP